MRIILKIVFFILIGFSAKAQIFQTNNAPYKFRGLKADTVLILPKGCDTPYLSNPKWGTSSGGALFADTCNNKLFLFNGVQWNEISGGGGSALDTISFRAGSVLDTLYYVQDGDTTDFYYVVVRDGLISGGVVTYSGFDLTYYVSAAVYRKGGVFYTTNDTTITIPPLSDTDSSRIDIFVVNTSGQATTIQGTEGANPVSPQIDPDTDVYLTFIELSPTNQNAGVDTVQIYDENQVPPEWQGGSVGLGGFDLNGTTNVYRGTKTTDVGAIDFNDIVGYKNSTLLDRNNYQGISFFIRLKQSLPINRNLFISFYSGSTTVSNEVIIPLTRTNTTSYQGVSIGFNQFTWTGTFFDSVRIRYSGGGPGISGFYLDNIYLQNGLTVVGGGTDTANISYRVDTLAADINNISSPVCGFYDFSTTTTASDPGSGRLRLNNATYASVTQVYVSQTTNPGTDVTNLLGALKTGDFVYIQDKDNSTQFFRAVITSTTDNGSWWTLAVNDVTSGGLLFSNNADLGVCLLFGGEGLDTTGTGDLYIRNLRTPQENKTFNVVSGHLDSLYASGSGGLHLVSNNGTQVANFGAGGGSSAVFNGFSGYNSNIAANYTARSFTDKNYVDSSILAGAGSGTVTSVAAGVGLLASPSPITTTGTILADTGRATAQLITGATLNKVADSLAALSGAGGVPSDSLAWRRVGVTQRINTVGWNTIYSGTVGASAAAAARDSANLLWGIRTANAMTTGYRNIALGRAAMKTATTGHTTVAIGDSAMANGNYTGNNNVAIGVRAMAAATSGNANVAIGANALAAINTGNINVAIGQNALLAATNNSNDIAIGTDAMDAKNSSSTTANIAIGRSAMGAMPGGGTGSNIAIGDEAMVSANNNGAAFNVGIGQRALQSNTTGQGNVGIGYYALPNNTTGSNNVFIGQSIFNQGSSTASNTIWIGSAGGTTAGNYTGTVYVGGGGSSYTLGNQTTTLGSLANRSLGDFNTAIGYSALQTVGSSVTPQDEDSSTAIGYQANAVTSAANPQGAINRGAGVYIGYRAAHNATGGATPETYTGNELIAIGVTAAGNQSAGDYNIALGRVNLASTTGSNQLAIGGNGIGWIRQDVSGSLRRTLINATTSDVTTFTASTALEVNGVNGAVLLPRLTTTERDALTATNGMIIYNTTTSKFQGYAGGTWVDFH